MAHGDVVLESVVRGLQSSGWDAVLGGNSILPDILIFSSTVGVLGLDVSFFDDKADDTQIKIQSLAKKRRQLRQELEGCSAKPPIQVALVQVDNVPKSGETDESKRYLRRLDLSKYILQNPLTSAELVAIEEAKRLFAPQYQFETRKPIRSDDIHSEQQKREKLRFRLDERQRNFANDLSKELVVLKGPAGSGKTLVLAARAKFLSSIHPEWTILLVCFNNALKPYLQSQVKGLRNVQVKTFNELLVSNNHRFTMKDSTDYLADFQLERMAAQGKIRETVDALLVDEAQDFRPAWLEYLILNVRPGHGGTLMVGDENQSIFRSRGSFKNLAKFKPTYGELSIPYRSTGEILEFVNCIIPELQFQNVENAPKGPLPALVFVLGGIRSGFQAHAIISDILKAKELNAALKWKDFAVLCTRHDEQLRPLAGQMQRILTHLFGNSNMLQPVFRRGAGDLDLQHDSIKLMTAHSAKGLEFSQVLLVGLESLAKEYSELPADIGESDELAEFRLNLVAPTRAKDNLTVYYSKQNVFLNRLVGHEELYVFRRYPEDYEVDEEWPN